MASGEDLKKKDSNGMTALMHAAKRGQIEAVSLRLPHEGAMQDRNGEIGPMKEAASEDAGIAKEHLDEFEGQEKSGQTALIYATGHGRTETTRLLAPISMK